MTILHILFPLAVVTPPLVTVWAMAKHRDTELEEALSLALMILAVWCAGRVMTLTLTPPEGDGLNAAFDLFTGALTLGSWFQRRRLWKLLLVGLFGIQVPLAAGFWFSWEILDRQLSYLDYLRWNNVLWLAELACVGWPGGRRVARLLIDGLHGGVRSHGHMGVPR